MKLNIKQLGAIDKVEIDLTKDLIVFCGPNNTNKTYVAYCIYALNRISYTNKNNSDLNADIPGYVFSLDLDQFILKHKKKIEVMIKKNFKEYVRSIFGIDKDTEAKIFPNLEIELDFDDEYVKKKMSSEMKFDITFNDELCIKLKKQKDSYLLESELVSSEKTTEEAKEKFLPYFKSSIVVDVILRKILFYNAYMASVERNSIYTFSKELSLTRNVLVDKLLELKDSTKSSKINNPFDLLERRSMRYPMPIRDGLSIAEDLRNLKKFESFFEEFAAEIENHVLCGKVNINDDGEVGFIPSDSNVELPIHITGSVVKSLSSLVFYFRHLAKEGDFIIIDEPELNLHPDKQIVLTKIIGRMLNKGFKVLINTHSDYIVKGLNNLVALSKETVPIKKLRTKYKYKKDELISKERVQAYFFDNRDRNKCRVSSIITDDNGFDVETIDKVISRLDEELESIYYALNE